MPVLIFSGSPSTPGPSPSSLSHGLLTLPWMKPGQSLTCPRRRNVRTNCSRAGTRPAAPRRLAPGSQCGTIYSSSRPLRALRLAPKMIVLSDNLVEVALANYAAGTECETRGEFSRESGRSAILCTAPTLLNASHKETGGAITRGKTFRCIAARRYVRAYRAG